MKITLYVMLAIGGLFWIGTLVVPGFNWPMLLLSALLVGYCVFELMTIADEEGDDD